MKSDLAVYLDTSIYLHILLKSRQMRSSLRSLEEENFCSSVFMFLEAERNLIRMSREKTISSADFNKCNARLKEDIEIFLLRELTLDLCSNKDFPAIQTPRSSDLVHLRTALWFYREGKLKYFLSSDKKQIQAAIELGLPVRTIP